MPKSETFNAVVSFLTAMLFHLPFGLADSPPFDKKHYKQVSSKESTKFYEGLPLLRCIRTV